jgi:predicted negative regulator of RcsB-dependent stress response
VAITVIFLLDAWDKAWPVILIIIGLGMVFGWRRAQTRDDRGRY